MVAVVCVCACVRPYVVMPWCVCGSQDNSEKSVFSFRHECRKHFYQLSHLSSFKGFGFVVFLLKRFGGPFLYFWPRGS